MSLLKMKTFSIISLAAALLPGPFVPSALADDGVINIRVSVKVIRSSTGAEPTNGLTAPRTVDDLITDEINRGNETLRRTQRGYRLLLLPVQRIQPAKPSGQTDADYWFTLAARENRAALETAAAGNTTTWKWDSTAMNVYINNTGSGQCSFPGDGQTIMMGTDIGAGTLFHEAGHFFNLSHTHGGDYDNPRTGATRVFTASELTDGDALAETANDNPNIITINQLSGALYAGATYASLPAFQQRVVNSAFENVMSYHNENELLPNQMNLFTDAANSSSSRHAAVSGYTRYVESYGSNTIVFGLSNDGLVSSSPLKTLAKAVANAGAANDGDEIILLGNAHFNEPMTISTPVTLRTSQGNTAVIGKP